MIVRTILLIVPMLVYGGCASTSPKAEKRTDIPAPKTRVVVVQKINSAHRKLSEKQESLLRTFAIKESPQLWQTVQLLRGEIDARNKSMTRLAADLREFDRKPEEDSTYRELQVGQEQILCALDNVYEKLENAYIAYKKFQATPSRKEYAEAMNRALEDGVYEAESTARRYRVMSIEK